MQLTRSMTSRAMFQIVVCGLLASSGCEPRPAPTERVPPPPKVEVAPTQAEAPSLHGASDWCGGHGLPESKCTQCNPELIPKFQASGDWCAEHEFPESVCPMCNPQTPPGTAVASDWCVEHALPESKCSKCNPSLVAELRAAGDFCQTHGFPESACPTCNPQTPPPGVEQAAIEARVVRFQSPDIERSAGIETVAATRGQTAAAVACTARIAFDADKLADVRAIVPGVVRRVRVELGATVEEGAPLFELESTRVGEIQGALATARGRVRTAKANLERKRELRASGIAAARQVEVAAQELATAKAEARTAEATLRMTGAARSKPSG
ncbi:MAG: efflux RND transporter periplasmic adaptor subunit, partial [Nannocystaceae bacterium]